MFNKIINHIFPITLIIWGLATSFTIDSLKEGRKWTWHTYEVICVLKDARLSWRLHDKQSFDAEVTKIAELTIDNQSQQARIANLRAGDDTMPLLVAMEAEEYQLLTVRQSRSEHATDVLRWTSLIGLFGAMLICIGTVSQGFKKLFNSNT